MLGRLATPSPSGNFRHMRRTWGRRLALLAGFFFCSACADTPTNDGSVKVESDGGLEAASGGGSASGGANPMSAGGAGGAGAGGRAMGGGVSDGSLGGAVGWTGGRGALDAALDSPFISGCVDGGSVIANGTWPPSPTTSDPKCNPNCSVSLDGGVGGGTSCGLQCNQARYLNGMPCDTGCCPTNQATPTAFGDNGPTGPSWNVVAVSPSGTECHASAYSLDTAYYTDLYISCSPARYTDTVPDMNATSPPGRPGTGCAGVARIAFGKAAGRDITYVAYATQALCYDPLSEAGPLRFGIGDGESWKFEDIPESLLDTSYSGAPRYLTRMLGLAADESGAPLLLTQSHILRRTGPGQWERFCIPDPPQFSLVVDQANGWYVAGRGTASRRDPDGSWATETTPFTAAALAVGGGTIHMTNGLKYARRVGTTWQEHTFAHDNFPANVSGDIASPSLVSMAIDACGAPHIGEYVTNGQDTFDGYYFRWTPAGWRSARFFSTCGYSNSFSIALSSSEALLAYYDDCRHWVTYHVPLK